MTSRRTRAERDTPGTGVSGDTARVMRHWPRIRRLGLERYIAELDVLGYTIVPPEVTPATALGLRLRDALLDVAQRRTGTRPSRRASIRVSTSVGAVRPQLLVSAL